MNFLQKFFVDVKRGTKVTYSESDLRKLDRTYEKEVLDNEKRRIRSPMRKVPQQAYLTQLRDYAYEKVLDSHMYTFQHLLVVPNPYDIVKQSALLLFNSGKETKIRYRVIGDVPEADFVGETGYTTRHRVPILGLYLKRSNKVQLEMINKDGDVVKRRLLRIYVSESPKKLENVLGENIRTGEEKKSFFPFLLLNGISFNPLVVDCEGKIRYSIQLRTNTIGMIPLENGHFLYEDRTANRMGEKGKIKSCRYHEMDYLGRVYRTYLLDFPIAGTVAQHGNSFYMVTASDDEHVLDCIIEVDRKSGNILKKCELAKILGSKYKTREDWAHISKIGYHNGNLVIALKRLHTVFEYNWEKEELVWVLAPDKIWKGQKTEQFLLKGDRENSRVCWKPDHISVIEKRENADIEELTLFQVKSNGDVKIAPKDAKDSAFEYLQVDTKSRTFRTVYENSWVKNRLHGSGFFSKNQKGILLCSGTSKAAVAARKGQITEIDKESKQEIRTMYTKKGINTVWEFEPDITGYGNAVPVSKDVIFGTLASPEEFTGELTRVMPRRISREIFSSTRLCDELFISYFIPGTISKIYFVGENHSYVQDYSSMKNGKVKLPFAITLEKLKKDTYYVYVEFEGDIYKLKNEFRMIR